MSYTIYTCDKINVFNEPKIVYKNHIYTLKSRLDVYPTKLLQVLDGDKASHMCIRLHSYDNVFLISYHFNLMKIHWTEMST